MSPHKIAKLHTTATKKTQLAPVNIGTALAHALALAAEGLAVLPLHYVKDDGHCSCGNACPPNNRGKHPKTTRGVKDATTDEATIRRWFEKKRANLGLGVPDGMIVVDHDPRNGGDESSEAIVKVHGEWPDTRTVATGGGGLHRYYRVPEGLAFPANLNGQGWPGVDIKQLGGYVLAPPSNHASGGAYVGGNREITDAPEWLIALGHKRGERGNGSSIGDISLDDLDLERLSQADRDRCDQIVEILEPEFVEGSKHPIAVALGQWLAASNGWKPEAAAYIAGSLPTDNPEARMVDALWAFGLDSPPTGYKALAGLVSTEAMAALDPIVNHVTEAMAERREKRKAKTSGPKDDDERTGYDPAVDHVIDHLAEPSRGVYQRAGLLVTVTREAIDDSGIVRPAGSPTIRVIPTPRLKEIITMTAGPRLRDLASTVVARGEWAGIRPLDAIVSYPVMRRDGTLLLTSGYDAQTRTLAEISIKVDVPDAPTRKDARRALQDLESLVQDFPFVGAGRAAWLAALLTVVARPAIDGPTPMLLVDATERGSGKTLLSDVISMITTGEPAPRRTAPETAEEWRKVIFAMLLAGDPICLIDNVTRMLASAALDAMLTGTTYQDRVLGVSDERRVAVRTVMIASANNCRVSTDLVRRSLHCRLEPAEEQPETRTGFAHTDLLGHVRRERARYLTAALTILRAYAVADRPAVKARAMGSYNAWCRVVRDALVWVGAADPAETQDALREDADVERDELRDLLTAWHAVLEDTPVTVRELLGKASGTSGVELIEALRGITPGDREPTAHTIGNRLRVLRGQMIGGLVLREKRIERDNVRRWAVVKV